MERRKPGWLEPWLPLLALAAWLLMVRLSFFFFRAYILPLPCASHPQPRESSPDLGLKVCYIDKNKASECVSDGKNPVRLPRQYTSCP